MWDFETLVPIKSHYNYDSAINDASFSHDSQFVALGGEEQTIKINHTTTGTLYPVESTFCVVQCNCVHLLKICLLKMAGKRFGTQDQLQ